MADASPANPLLRAAFPRSSHYDADWVFENLMGPNVLWLTESLAALMDLRPGMRVLDLGCGKAISSIFLAREFGVQVWATDLWIHPSENWARIEAAGVGDRVFPIYAKAHALPFANGFFDVAVSMDAYHYFGTDDLYIGTFVRLVRRGGQLGICVPGLVAEFGGDIPEHLEPFWDWQFHSFHSPAWWRRHWEKSGMVSVTHAEMLPEGWRYWQDFLEIAGAHGYPRGRPPDPPGRSEADMLRVDAGRHLGFTQVVATRR